MDVWPFDLCPDLDPPTYLGRVGGIFATFDVRTQDSGNISFGVEAGGRRWFVKTAGPPSDTSPFLDHSGRVELLRNAARLAASVQHPSMPQLHAVIPSAWGAMLVYDWVAGELVGAPVARRGDPTSGYIRFRSLPVPELSDAIDVILDAHVKLCAAGWIACDFYDGAVIYNFELRKPWLVDLDNYHQGPFANPMGRMFGSTRFMAPEEFELGARIDERTTVFTLGRAISEFLGGGSLERDAFRGPRHQHQAMVRACQPDRTRRPPKVADLIAEWRMG